MASRHKWIPDLLSWTTYSDLEYRFDQVEYEIGPYTQMNPNIDEHVAFAGGCKDAKVLEQDR